MSPLPLIQRIRGFWEVDTAVGYALWQKFWLLFAGPVNLLLVVVFASPSAQGFYYTFASIMAMQSFAELGFYIVIISVASHEWVRLRLDETGSIIGDHQALSRLVSLGRLIFRWYAVSAVIFMLGAGLIGWMLMRKDLTTQIAWETPWLLVTLLTGLNFWIVPFIYLLEGCNQLASLNAFRLRQAILANFTFWAVLPYFGPLWGLAGIAFTSLLTTFHFLFIQNRNFFRPFWKHPTTEQIDWLAEIWPLQWRLAVQGAVQYCVTNIFTPIMFHYHGAVQAGQMGMTRQILSSLESISSIWIQTRVPSYGMLIAERKFHELDSKWAKNSKISLLVILLGGGAFWLGLLILGKLDVPLAGRLLIPSVTALMLVSVFLTQIIQCEAAYLRAHKKEPLMLIGVGNGILTGLLAWQFGKVYGAVGIAVASLAVMTLFTFPGATIIWMKCRKEWHANKG